MDTSATSPTAFRPLHNRKGMGIAAAVLAILFAVNEGEALVIVPTWDGSITKRADAAAVKAGIQAALADYGRRFSDSVTVSIVFADVTDGLGSSNTQTQNLDYRTFRSMLAARATTTDDATALAHLPNSDANPVNQALQMDFTLPHLRALGVSAPPPQGSPDSTISLNLSIMNYTRTSIDPAKYDLAATVYHEVNEVLGLNSDLDGLNNGDPAPTDSIGVMDLFRYDASGHRSFTTDVNAEAFFSIDGVHHIVQYNQDASGDFHDWYSVNGSAVPRVQDAFGTPGTWQDQSAAELTALDVIGYTPAATASSVAATGARYSAGAFSFDVTANAPATIVIESTTDTKTWTPVSTNSVTGTLHFTDSTAGLHKAQFYRAKVQ
jgi:hypothetical protein